MGRVSSGSTKQPSYCLVDSGDVNGYFCAMLPEVWTNSDRSELLRLFVDTAQKWTKEKDIDIRKLEHVDGVIECLLVAAVKLAAEAGKSEWSADGRVTGGSQKLSETFEFQMMARKIGETLRN